MPELPEVETVARGLRRRLTGTRLTAVEIYRDSVFRGASSGSRSAQPAQAVASPAARLAEIEGASVHRIRRGGKYLVIELDQPGGRRWQLMFHLGMTGQLVLRPPGQARRTHTHAVFHFDNSLELHFRDPRRFGRIALAPAPSGADPEAFAPELGIAAGAEPLEVSEDRFLELFRGRNAPIKSALMNQKLLRGLGNIYADESLFRAGISPRARRVSRPRLRRLRASIREVLREAMAAGGSSISDYLDSDGQPGWFHLSHRVYGRTGEPCLACHAPIRQVVLAGRSAHFCPHCQKR